MEGSTGRNEIAPRADDLLNRLERATQQNARGKHRSYRRITLDHEVCAESENQGLHREPQKTDDALHPGSTITRSDLPLQHAAAVMSPPAQQALSHAHGTHDAGVPPAHPG